ncbi:hypothetical protein SO802_025421 [Lithocarpus litseifolius]|uniref:Reverse transcriptase n=1 Tax=Lithocarpus litseifolius TaxID=425828 RepID=A0AAW2BWR4_9ROSI
MEKCGQELEKWSKRNFSSVRRELEKKRKLLSQAEATASRGGDANRVKILENEVNMLMDREAKMWSQRAKVQWLKDRDRNSRFFHGKCSQRRRRNYIKGLFDGEGRWCTQPKKIVDTVVNFYQDLFTSSNPVSLEEVLEQIPLVVTADMNLKLMSEFTAHEVEIALKQMAPLKSPGPDSMPPLFYQSYWSMVDDSLVFCRAKETECQKLLDILAKYEHASGQQINREKTTLFFNKSTPHDMQEAIKNALGVPVVQQYEKYLGLPSFIGRKKKASFDNIKQRVWKKLQGWEGKLLSQAGREILIKSVAQALPTSTMSCFKLSAGLCHEIKVLIKIFFWGQRGERRKVHWMKWEDLCKPKSQGGMGFKDLSKFNDTLLAKQTWRLLHDKTLLFYRVFKAKFFPNCTIMEAANPSLSSYAWRSILRG